MKHNDFTMTAAKTLVESILRRPQDHEWDLQGFGMLRTRPTEVSRLNVWDSRYQYKPRPSMIHDHPWSFSSLIVCGVLDNIIYDVRLPDDRGKQMMERRIQPGMNPKIIGKDRPVSLDMVSDTIYTVGGSYHQEWNLVHDTRYEDSTITLNVRDRGDRPDVARVFYPVNGEWHTAVPRPATIGEVYDICHRALERWFK